MTGNGNTTPFERISRFELLYHLTQTFNSTLNLNDVLDRVIDEVIAATRAERGFLMLREEGGKLSFRTARGLDHTIIDDPEFQMFPPHWDVYFHATRLHHAFHRRETVLCMSANHSRTRVMRLILDAWIVCVRRLD